MNSYYGGRSIWGKLDALASRYHWTFDYIIWGISWANVQLMLADGLRVDYKSSRGEQRDELTVIDLSKPDGMEKLTKMARMQ